MKKIISILKKNHSLLLIIIGFLSIIYFGYQIIKPISDVLLKKDSPSISFDKISEYLKE